MPARKSARMMIGDMPSRGAGGRDFNTDEEKVNFALDEIDEIAALPESFRNDLVEQILASVGHRRAGVDVGRRGVSNEKVSMQLFYEDVKRVLGKAGLSTSRWSKKYDGGEEEDECLPFRVFRSVCAELEIPCPRDLKHLARRAAKLKYL